MKKLLSIHEATNQILRCIQPLTAEKIPTSSCVNRILREDIQVPFDIPAFDRSAMDGYALAGETSDRIYRITAVISAGSTQSTILQPGECARIFTGAPIPKGSDRVVIQEECFAEGDRLQIAHPIKPKSNIRFRAEEAHAGEIALLTHQILGTIQLGIAASLGKAELLVSREPVIGILSTGTELIESGQPLKHGQIYNSNGLQLASQIVSWGGKTKFSKIVGDDLPNIIHQIQNALEQQINILCISGGASVGEADYTRTALEQCGFKIQFHGIDLKPGKPALFATKDQIFAFGIPGNPVSHLAVAALLIAPAIRALLALPPIKIKQAELRKTWNGKADQRDRWLPAKIEHHNTRIQLEILSWKGSADLMACRQANAVANIPASQTILSEGSVINYMPLEG